MARAREVEGLGADVPFAQAAARVVEVRAQELFDHAAGVLDVEDPERVHDMRVATRRLRAVLEIFAPCFPRKPHRAVLREVKALADVLGERRDPDVQIAALHEYQARTPPQDAAGVDALVQRLREEQARANARLAVALAEMERSDLRARLAELVDEAGR